MKRLKKRSEGILNNNSVYKLNACKSYFLQYQINIYSCLDFALAVLICICWILALTEEKNSSMERLCYAYAGYLDEAHSKGMSEKLEKKLNINSQNNFFISDAFEKMFDIKEDNSDEVTEESTIQVNNEEVTTEKIDSYIIENINGMCQLPELPTGCEATALTVVMNYRGIKANKYNISMVYMPRREFYYKDGFLYGEDPTYVFMGNPSKNSGLGCFAPCLVKTFDNFSSRRLKYCKKYQPIDLTGSDFEIILQNYVAKGNPVVVIVSPYLYNPYKGTEWKLENGGKWIWEVNHHAMVVYGFDLTKKQIYVCDPLSSTGKATYDLSRFEEIYNLKGKSAMTIIEK